MEKLTEHTPAHAEVFNGRFEQLINNDEYLKQQVDLNSDRINNMTTLQEGSTTGDAELKDIRVGADGRIYDNAGTATREQIGRISGEIDEIRTVEDTNLITFQQIKLTKNEYYSSSAGGYITYEGRDCIKNIKVEPLATYYACASEAVFFDVNGVYLGTTYLTLNGTKAFETPENADFVTLNYNGSPNLITPGTEANNGYYLSSYNGTQTRETYNKMLLKDENFSKFKREYSEIIASVEKFENSISVLNYSKRIDLSNVTVDGTYGRILPGTHGKFSSKPSTIYAVEANNAYFHVDTDIKKWKSLTFCFYIPWDAVTSDSPYRSDFCFYIKGYTGHKYHFIGKMRAGWNYVKFTKDDVNQEDDLTSIQRIYFYLSALNEAQEHGFITLDSIFVDLELKPTVSLMFDQIWQESIDNGAYEYMRQKGIPYTISTKNYDSLNDNQLSEIKTMRLYGDDFGYYACYGQSNEAVVNAENYQAAVDNLETAINDCISITGVRPVVYSATRGLNSEIMQEATRAVGFEYICGGVTNSLECTYIQKDVPNSLVRKSIWETMTIEEIKDYIDTLIEYGSFSLLFTHGICADGNAYMSVNGELTTSSGVQLSIFKSTIDYLVDLRNEGKINICLLRNLKNII